MRGDLLESDPLVMALEKYEMTMCDGWCAGRQFTCPSKVVAGVYQCTGHAHLGGIHITCNCPCHKPKS